MDIFPAICSILVLTHIDLALFGCGGLSDSFKLGQQTNTRPPVLLIGNLLRCIVWRNQIVPLQFTNRRAFSLSISSVYKVYIYMCCALDNVENIEECA